MISKKNIIIADRSAWKCIPPFAGPFYLTHCIVLDLFALYAEKCYYITNAFVSIAVHIARFDKLTNVLKKAEFLELIIAYVIHEILMLTLHSFIQK